MTDKRRDVRQAEDARTLGPKGTWSGTGAQASPVADAASPAEQPALPRAGPQTQGGKPVVLPEGEAHRKVSGWEGGETRMAQAKAALEGSREGGCHPPRKRADFHLVSRHEHNRGIDKEGVANDGGCCALVRPSPSGKRLMFSIVQPAGCITADGSFTRPLRCLSGVR